MRFSYCVVLCFLGKEGWALLFPCSHLPLSLCGIFPPPFRHHALLRYPYAPACVSCDLGDAAQCLPVHLDHPLPHPLLKLMLCVFLCCFYVFPIFCCFCCPLWLCLPWWACFNLCRGNIASFYFFSSVASLKLTIVGRVCYQARVRIRLKGISSVRVSFTGHTSRVEESQDEHALSVRCCLVDCLVFGTLFILTAFFGGPNYFDRPSYLFNPFTTSLGIALSPLFFIFM